MYLKLATVQPEILINWLMQWSNHAEYYKLTEVFWLNSSMYLIGTSSLKNCSISCLCFFYSDKITITIQHYMDINEADTGSRKHTMALCYSSLNLQILMYNKAYIDYKIFYRVFLSWKRVWGLYNVSKNLVHIYSSIGEINKWFISFYDAFISLNM